MVQTLIELTFCLAAVFVVDLTIAKNKRGGVWAQIFVMLLIITGFIYVSELHDKIDTIIEQTKTEETQDNG